MKNETQRDFYEIQVRGHLDERRIHALGDFMVAHTPQGQTILRGHLKDQAALFGCLNRLRDLGIPLVAVNLLEYEKSSMG